MKSFVLNGKSYPVKELGFNFICDLEDKGISLEDMDSKALSLIRYYISYCIGSDEKRAGEEIESHLANGGKLTEIADVLNEAMSNSGFFRSLKSKEKEKTPTTTTSKSKKAEKNVAISEA